MRSLLAPPPAPLPALLLSPRATLPVPSFVDQEDSGKALIESLHFSVYFSTVVFIIMK